MIYIKYFTKYLVHYMVLKYTIFYRVTRVHSWFWNLFSSFGNTSGFDHWSMLPAWLTQGLAQEFICIISKIIRIYPVSVFWTKHSYYLIIEMVRIRLLICIWMREKGHSLQGMNSEGTIQLLWSLGWSGPFWLSLPLVTTHTHQMQNDCGVRDLPWAAVVHASLFPALS